MPIVDVEVVGSDAAQPRRGAASALADAVGEVLGTPPGRTWVRLRTLGSEGYAENGGGPPAGVRPVFVTVLKATLPEPEAMAAECAQLAAAVGRVCARPTENVHVLYLPAAAGRIAFGGKLVRR